MTEPRELGIVRETLHLTPEEKLARLTGPNPEPVAFAMPPVGPSEKSPGHTDQCSCDDCFGLAEHRCFCAGCRPFWAPNRKRRHSGHFAAHFDEDRLTIVFKIVDGQEVFLPDVIEVDVDAGWAIRLTMPTHKCRTCYAAFCIYKDEGEFAVASCKKVIDAEPT